MSRILVVGSANLDHFVDVDVHPCAGHTTIGRNTRLACGGKGANQAVAAARLGGLVALVAAVGGDDAAQRLRQGLRDSGVDDSLVLDVDAPTGTAVITVSPDGSNSILVLTGANDLLDADAVRAAATLAEIGTVVVQMEVPDAAVAAAVNLASSEGARLIVNLAPYRHVDADILAAADPLVLNEHEAAALTGVAYDPTRPHALALAVGGYARSAIVTLGADGALCVRHGTATAVAARAVTAVDTTGAGDAFVGAVAVALDRDDDIIAAARYATEVAAISVTRHGAQPSYPTKAELARRARGGNRATRVSSVSAP